MSNIAIMLLEKDDFLHVSKTIDTNKSHNICILRS